MNMVLYIDGSRRALPKRTSAIGWGLVALHNGHHIEHTGGLLVNNEACGDHEMFALVEGVRFALTAGVPFDQLSVFSDDETVAYGAQALHPGNYCQDKARALTERLNRVTNRLGAPDTLRHAVLECLTTSRFVKVKAHRRTVYQNRADYLAKKASQRAAGESATVRGYDDWLAQGFLFYLDAGQSTEVWYPPFVPSPVEEPQLELALA